MLACRAAADAIKFTVDQTALKKKTQASSGVNSITKAAHTAPDLTPTNSSKQPSKAAVFEAQMAREKQLAAMVCSLENKDECLMCGS